MNRTIVHDPLFLALPSTPASQEDLPTAQDLRDTLQANQAGCVGLAANMIGVRKRIIIAMGLVMLNPEIVSKQSPYEAEEGCLSLSGLRKTRRYNKIEVTWQDEDMKPHCQWFEGYMAQVIQHEVDHCEGVLI